MKLFIQPMSTAVLSTGILLITMTGSLAIAQDRGGFDAKEYFQRMDANQNGKLEPSEVSGRSQRFLQGMGLDTNETLSIKEVVKKFDQRRQDGRQNQEESNDKNNSPSTLKVPAFGAEESPVPGFGLIKEDALLSTYSEGVLRQVNDSLREWDQNKDGILDQQEVQRARWGNPSPADSDTNHDGKLTKIELANRYKARELVQRDDQNNRGGDRNRDSERDRERDRDSEQRNQGDRGRNDNGGDRGRFGSSQSASSQTRPSSTSASSSSSRSTGGSSSQSSADSLSKYASYVKSLITEYDKDKDGRLSKEEIKTMRRPPVNADQDNDGYISQTELVNSLAGVKNNSSGSSGSSDSSVSTSSTPRGSSQPTGSFGGLDVNKNNQIEMHEFSKDWDEAKIKDFYSKDKNRDGVITANEWNTK